MAISPASVTAPVSGKTVRWPPAWLTNVGVVIGLGIIVLLSSMAIGAAATSMTEHGVSVGDFQFAGTPAKAELAYNELGHNGRRAAWWFLALELPFLISYGLLLCAGCAFAALKLAAAGAERLARIARFAAVFGLLAAGSDLIQNSALVVNLTGHFAQPFPRLAVVFGDLTWVFGISAGFVFVAGWIIAALRSRQAGPGASASIIGLDHVQVAVPLGCEDDSRRFYGDLLGLPELEKPEALKGRGGVWFACGAQQLHVGVIDDFSPATKAHPALRVSRLDLDAIAERLTEAGSTVQWDDAIPSVRRFYTADPWGNRIELLVT